MTTAYVQMLIAHEFHTTPNELCKLCMDIDPKTGKLTQEHLDECAGCALCEE